MTIPVTCNQCGTGFEFKDSQAGKWGTCPNCRRPLVVPVPDDMFDDLPDEDEVEEVEVGGFLASLSESIDMQSTSINGPLSDSMHQLLDVVDASDPMNGVACQQLLHIHQLCSQMSVLQRQVLILQNQVNVIMNKLLGETE